MNSLIYWFASGIAPSSHRHFHFCLLVPFLVPLHKEYQQDRHHTEGKGSSGCKRDVKEVQALWKRKTKRTSQDGLMLSQTVSLSVCQTVRLSACQTVSLSDCTTNTNRDSWYTFTSATCYYFSWALIGSLYRVCPLGFARVIIILLPRKGNDIQASLLYDSKEWIFETLSTKSLMYTRARQCWH